MIFIMFISEMRENMKLFFINCVDYTQKERVFVLDLHGRVLAAGGAAVRRDQVNPPQSFLVSYVGSGGIPGKNSNWERYWANLGLDVARKWNVCGEFFIGLMW